MAKIIMTNKELSLFKDLRDLMQHTQLQGKEDRAVIKLAKKIQRKLNILKQ